MRKVICDYCGGIARFIDSAAVYGISYGMIYYCDTCHAWVGVHRGTDKPLGTLANEELRQYRRRAHDAFDQIWKRHGVTRPNAYKWLASAMNLSKEDTHIGMFNINQCLKVIEICSCETRANTSLIEGHTPKTI